MNLVTSRRVITSRLGVQIIMLGLKCSSNEDIGHIPRGSLQVSGASAET